MPESLPSAERPYHKDRFIYDERSDSFTCPKGQTLHFERVQRSAKKDGVRNRIYRAHWKVCCSCPAFGVCTKSERGRAVAIGRHDATLRGHRAWMSTDTAKEAYKLRKQLVEPVFGIIKEQQRARRFLLRGLPKVSPEWTVFGHGLHPPPNLPGSNRQRTPDDKSLPESRSPTATSVIKIPQRQPSHICSRSISSEASDLRQHLGPSLAQ